MWFRACRALLGVIDVSYVAIVSRSCVPCATYATLLLGVSNEIGGTSVGLTTAFVVLICDCVVPDAPPAGSATDDVRASFEDTLKSIDNDAVSVVS